MFVDANETIDIALYYKKEGKHYLVLILKDMENLTQIEKNEFKVVNIKMKAMTWGLFNDLQDQGYEKGINNERMWNYKLYKQNRLKNLIVSWDAKKTNAKGEQENVPVTQENILSLAPEIAEAILAVYNSEVHSET